MSPSSRAAAWATVIAVHALLALGLRAVTPWAERKAWRPADRPTVLRFVPIADVTQPAAPRPLRGAAPALPVAPALAWPDITLAVPAVVDAITPPTSRTAEPAASAPPLNLTLPAAAQRHTSPLPAPGRAAPISIEARIGAALDPGAALSEQTLDGDGRRIHQGRGCVEVFDARIASIDPFNESVKPTPKAARRCD